MSQNRAAVHAGNALDDIPFPVLIGDIGGTNARFALIETVDSALEQLPIVPTGDYPTIEDAIETAVLTKTKLRPRSAILALAGPITGERVRLTNCHWVVEARNIIARCAIGEIILLNDFEALSLSLADLKSEDIDAIGGGRDKGTWRANRRRTGYRTWRRGAYTIARKLDPSARRGRPY